VDLLLMDGADLHRGLLLLHLLGAFAFVAAHGASAAVTLRLRRERDPARIGALLDLSRSTRGFTYASLLLLLGAGIALGFVGHRWSGIWIWLSLALLAAMTGAAVALAPAWFTAIRRAAEREPVDAQELAALALSPRGLWLAWLEIAGVVAILALMVYKPM
jgi:uncharacterized membrane protein